MSRKNFEQQIHQAQVDILVLGDEVNTALGEAVDLLKRRDLEGSQRLVEADRRIDERRYAIESEVLTLIATQQPMAGDLRALAAVLFIVNELERIGDYAKGIARVNIRIGNEPLMKPLIDIPQMVDKTRSMLHRALEAFIHKNADVARAIIAEDDVVDGLYDQVYAELMTLIIQDTSKLRQANLLLMAAHNLERAADRVTNICERVIYSVTGRLEDAGWEEDVA